MRKSPSIWILTSITMLAFAANSILCRMALKRTSIDPASFTLVRIASGALMLWILSSLAGHKSGKAGNWLSAAALVGYAAAFSFAYVSLPVGTGALLLFGAVQATMIVRGFVAGERMNTAQIAGFIVAVAGLIVLVLPGIAAPPLVGAVLMAGAGVCWGIYSLRGRRSSDPLATTAGNFLRGAVFAVAVSLVFLRTTRPDLKGVLFAVFSGALASGVGYAIWYAALRGLTATRAAVVQLSVPVIAALGGVALLGERITLRLAISAVAVLGGIAFFVLERQQER